MVMTRGGVIELTLPAASWTVAVTVYGPSAIGISFASATPVDVDWAIAPEPMKNVTRSPRSANRRTTGAPTFVRSEEHTSELQSHSDIVCRLLLENKKVCQDA